MEKKPNLTVLLARLDGHLQRLEKVFSDNVRDFESWQDLLDALRQALLETNGHPDASFGFFLSLIGHGKEVIYSHLLELIRLGVFPIQAQSSLYETKEEVPRDALDEVLARFNGEILGQSYDECDLYEQRAFLVCYLKKDLFERLEDISKEIQVLRDDDPKLCKTAISISHFGQEQEKEMANEGDPGIETTLRKSTPEHQVKIMQDLTRVYLIDEKWDRPTFLFNELIRVLK